MISLRGRQVPIDVVPLADELKATGNTGRLPGGEGYLLSLATETPHPDNVMHYASIVGKHRAIRELEAAALEAVSAVKADPEHAAAALARAQVAMLRVTLGRHGSAETMIETGRRVLDEIERVAAGQDTSRVPTGIDRLDRKLRGGMRPGLILPMGLTGMGKSSLGIQVAVRGAADRKVPALVFSLEMTRAEVWSKMAANLTRKNSALFDPMPHTYSEWKEIQSAASQMNELRDLITIDETRELAGICARATAWRIAHPGRCLIVVDHAQKVQVRGDKKNRTREQEVAYVASTLQNMGQDMQVPIISPAQMNDKASDEGRPPRLGDSRESRGLEHESPVVLGIHRDRSEVSGAATISVLKNRFGELGPVDVSWVGAHQGFEDSDDVAPAGAVEGRWND
jgi:replicative DNA helicase